MQYSGDDRRKVRFHAVWNSPADSTSYNWRCGSEAELVAVAVQSCSTYQRTLLSRLRLQHCHFHLGHHRSSLHVRLRLCLRISPSHSRPPTEHKETFSPQKLKKYFQYNTKIIAHRHVNLCLSFCFYVLHQVSK